jgi:hypothetical protein
MGKGGLKLVCLFKSFVQYVLPKDVENIYGFAPLPQGIAKPQLNLKSPPSRWRIFHSFSCARAQGLLNAQNPS